MDSTLRDFECQFILQLVSRIYCANSYTDICTTISEQLKTLIPFKKMLCLQTKRQNGTVEVSNPFFEVGGNSEEDHIFTNYFLTGKYPRWSQFVMSPTSTVFRQSDIVTQEKWERSHVYRDLWQPQDIYHGLFISVVHHDYPLVIMSFFRARAAGDFSERDIFILKMLSSALENRFYQLSSVPKPYNESHIHELAKKYRLTRRETEIVQKICASKSPKEICDDLCITLATFNKHLSNVYLKTNINSRLQLYNLFTIK